MNSLSEETIDSEGVAHPKNIANYFHTTLKEIAELTGISIDAVSKKTRVNFVNSQKRLRDMIISRITTYNALRL